MTDTPLAGASSALPSWFVLGRSIIVSVYLGTLALCVAAVFLIGFGGMIVYRDFDSYTLAGNPWEPSNLPWYVIWPMRLMSIIGAMFVAGGGFAIVDGLVLRGIADPAHAAGSGRRLVAATITIAVGLVLAGWLLRWF